MKMKFTDMFKKKHREALEKDLEFDCIRVVVSDHVVRVEFYRDHESFSYTEYNNRSIGDDVTINIDKLRGNLSSRVVESWT